MNGYYCVIATYDKWNRPLNATVERVAAGINPASWVTWVGEERTECDAYPSEKEAFKAMHKIMKAPKKHRLLVLTDLFIRCVKEAFRDGI